MLSHDLTYGARALARRPGFTLAAGLSLALGIGATTAVFTVLNAVALRPLPYVEGDRLVWMTQIIKANTTDDVTLTGAFLEWRRQNGSFTDLAAYMYVSRNLSGATEPAEVETARASASLLPILGVQPALGRNFLKSEDYKGRDAVALVSDGLWRQQFAGDPKIIGRPITLDGRQYIVVGVLPRDFAFPGAGRGRGNHAAGQGRSRRARSHGRVDCPQRGGPSAAGGDPGTGARRADRHPEPFAAAALQADHHHPDDAAARAPVRQRRQGRHGAGGGGRVPAADRLRQRQPPAAGAADGARPRAGHPHGAGRVAQAPGGAASHRERPAGGAGLGGRDSDRVCGALSAAGVEPLPRGGLREPAVRWPRAGLRRGHRHAHHRCCSAWRRLFAPPRSGWRRPSKWARAR